MTKEPKGIQEHVKGGEMMKKWMQRLNQKTQSDKGVTLIELLAVIVIIAIIAAIAVPVVLSSIRNSKTNTDKQNMSIVVEALNRYAADNDGQYPLSSGSAVDAGSQKNTAGLLASKLSPQYIQQIPQDPWGNDYYYKSDGSSFTLETAQADSSGNSGEVLYYTNTMTSADKSLPSSSTTSSTSSSSTTTN